MGKPLMVYRNVPVFKEWPTNFKLLFQTLVWPNDHNYSNKAYNVWQPTKHSITTINCEVNAANYNSAMSKSSIERKCTPALIT